MNITFIDQLQQLVGSLNGWITQALHGNTIIAGAVTASVAGSLFFLLRKVPSKLWNRVRRYIFFTYEIEYSQDSSYDRTMISEVAAKFEYELQKHVSNSRPSARLITRKKRLVETLSDGGFFHRYKSAWIWISRGKETGNGPAVKGESTNPKNVRITLSMTALRFHRDKILEMLGDSVKEYIVPGIYQVYASSWGGGAPSVSRTRNFTAIPILAIDHQIKKTVDEAIDNFVRNRAANNAADKLHKLVFMFYGEPGTGKSALAEYVAFRLRASLFCVNAQTSSGSVINLSTIMDTARDNVSEDEIPVVLVDDFDTVWSGLHRRSEDAAKKAIADGAFPMPEDPSLGRLLVSLQSPTEINDCVVVFTTNHLEKIDEAVYRPGRVTVLIEVGRMGPRSIMEYFAAVYEQSWVSAKPIERALRACDVTAYYNQNTNNPQGFINAVMSNTAAADEIFQAKQTEVVS